MRSNLSRTLAVAAAALLLPSAYADFTPGWAPIDYPLLGLAQPRSHTALMSLATPLIAAAVTAGISMLARSRRPARFGAYLAVGAVLHWFLFSPVQHGTFVTDLSAGVWLALGGAALLGLSSIVPEEAGSSAPSVSSPGRLTAKDREAIANASAARHRAARSSVAWMLEQMAGPSRR